MSGNKLTRGGALILLFACLTPPYAVAQVPPADGEELLKKDTTPPQSRPATQPGGGGVPDLTALLSKPQHEMWAVVQRYEADRGNLTRFYTIAVSPTRYARLRLFCTDWLAALDRLDATKFGDEGKAAHGKLKETIQAELKRLDADAVAQAKAMPLVPFAPVVIRLDEARRGMESVDPQKAAATLDGLRKGIAADSKALQDRVTAGDHYNKAVVTRAAETTAALRNVLRGWFGFYNDYDPLFTWWATQSYKEVDGALGEYAAYLKDKLAPQADGEPNDNFTTTVPELVLTGKEPEVPDLRELVAFPQSEMRGVLQAYQGNRGGRGGAGGGRGGQGGQGNNAGDNNAGGRGQGQGGQAGAAARQANADWLAALGKIDFDALSHDGKVDYVLLRSRIDADVQRQKLRDNPPAVPRLRDDSGITGRPIGREGLMAELAAEMIPYTPDELIRIAEKEYAWCEAEMKKASREMGYGDDWKQAVEKAKTMYVPPGKQPDVIRDLALEATKYVEDNNLVTVPQVARESWRMDMMTPQRQLVNPFFTGGETISVSYPTSTMSYQSKLESMRGNNIPFSHATVFHELIPGHHLQGYMAARFRTHRRLFNTPFWGEGWALYWEMFLYERGFNKTPEHRVGALFWRMHRCARIVFSLGFHSGKMSPQQCIDYLVEKVGHERENATAEVRRSFGGGYGPLYQAAYMLGGLQLRELHQEVVAGGKMTDRQFHDALLKEGSIPVAMMRASLTGQKLTRDYQPNWKFYGDNP